MLSKFDYFILQPTNGIYLHMILIALVAICIFGVIYSKSHIKKILFINSIIMCFVINLTFQMLIELHIDKNSGLVVASFSQLIILCIVVQIIFNFYMMAVFESQVKEK